MIKISKELYEQVLGIKLEDFNLDLDDLKNIDYKAFYFKCKEWAFKKDFEIVVFAYMIRIYKNGYEVYNTNTTLFDLDMFFKACEWIREKLK